MRKDWEATVGIIMDYTQKKVFNPTTGVELKTVKDVFVYEGIDPNKVTKEYQDKSAIEFDISYLEMTFGWWHFVRRTMYPRVMIKLDKENKVSTFIHKMIILVYQDLTFIHTTCDIKESLEFFVEDVMKAQYVDEYQLTRLW